jgi:hypothetical protein
MRFINPINQSNADYALWKVQILLLLPRYLSKGLIPRALFLGEMRNISHEMKSCMRSKDKLGFAGKISLRQWEEVRSTHCESEKRVQIQ